MSHFKFDNLVRSFSTILSNLILFVLEKLNSHHSNIQLTHKIEENQKIRFLDVLITVTTNNKLETKVIRKETSRDLHVNWNSPSLIQRIKDQFRFVSMEN